MKIEIKIEGLFSLNDVKTILTDFNRLFNTYFNVSIKTNKKETILYLNDEV